MCLGTRCSGNVVSRLALGSQNARWCKDSTAAVAGSGPRTSNIFLFVCCYQGLGFGLEFTALRSRVGIESIQFLIR